MNPSHTIDDDDLKALLRSTASAEPLDDGFSDAVMRRVLAEQAAELHWLDAQTAMALLRQGERTRKRAAYWQRIGALAGALLAAVALWAMGGMPLALSASQQGVLFVGLLATAWATSAGAARDA